MRLMRSNSKRLVNNGYLSLLSVSFAFFALFAVQLCSRAVQSHDAGQEPRAPTLIPNYPFWLFFVYFVSSWFNLVPLCAFFACLAVLAVQLPLLQALIHRLQPGLQHPAAETLADHHSAGLTQSTSCQGVRRQVSNGVTER